MNARQLFKFSFKREAMWMMLFSFAPAILGLLIFLIVMLLRRA